MQELNKANYWIEKLGLEPHPEGGHFKEIYRSELLVEMDQGERNIAISIYYMLQKNEFSSFHRLKSDELWYFHDGDPIEVIVIDELGKVKKVVLGLEPEKSIYPQTVISKNQWFAARSLGNFTLVGCQVAPGFDFADFEMGSKKLLTDLFPQHVKIIEQFY